MQNFTAFNPTRLHLGRNVVNDLGFNALQLGKHALVVYGGGSVLKNGSYSDTVEQLKRQNIRVTEYSGIKPNPVVDNVMEAAKIGMENGVDMVVAIGGGSVIDSSKIIAVCIADNCEAWELMTRKHIPVNALPLIAVLTLSATGTEMNGTAVLQNPQTRQKIGFNNEVMYPKHSFLDPNYTLSVSREYTAYGIVDLIAHCLEAWFGEGDASLSDRFVIAIIQEAMDFGPALLIDLENYVLRERMMWAATNALNNLTIYGRSSADWGVHALGHVLSFLYDTPHGASLSVLYPAWMKMMQERAASRIIQLGRSLFGVSTVEDTAGSFIDLFSSLGSPTHSMDAGIEPSCRGEILDLMNKNRAEGMNHKLSDAEREELLTYVF